MKKFFIFLFSLLFLIVALGPVFAQEDNPAIFDEEGPKEVNSFEVFWPLVAGKTRADTVYPIKNLKEKVRGLLIFGAAQKVDYAVLMGTKRVLEAEKLINENRGDLAEQTLQDAIGQFSKAEKIIGNGLDLGQAAHTISQRINNLTLLLNWLKDKGETPNSTDELLKLLESLSSKV